ncbi:hypothetical protein DER46DRAFT_608207 [Fusarium sp. MPI-SDFR-AT-0072]|nr:hypothetical protein DER46DRAFT_608207 [Fusarium sp. MPI-SDFR-AT-0072]
MAIFHHPVCNSLASLLILYEWIGHGLPQCYLYFNSISSCWGFRIHPRISYRVYHIGGMVSANLYDGAVAS